MIPEDEVLRMALQINCNDDYSYQPYTASLDL